VDVVGDSGDEGDGEFGGPGGRREAAVRVGTGWSGDESCGCADRVELDALQGRRCLYTPGDYGLGRVGMLD
jgi:hypothetical protein